MSLLVGAPRCGKSTVMRLVANGRIAGLQTGLVSGYAEASPEVGSLPLLALAMAYQRWLSRSNWREQATMLKLAANPPAWTKVLSGLAHVARAGDPVGGAILVKIAEALNAGERTWAQLESKPIPVEQLHDRIALLARASNSRVLLALDGIDQLADSTQTTGLLMSLLKSRDPRLQSVHVIASSRVEGDECLSDSLEELAAMPACEVFRIGPIDVQDSYEKRDLLAFLRHQIPTTRQLEDLDLLALIGGSAAVIDQWLVEKPTTRAELISQAEDAHAQHYISLQRRIRALAVEDSAEAEWMRTLLVLPRFNSAEHYRDFLQSAFDGCAPVSDALRSKLLLDAREGSFPSLGHETRHASAKRAAMEMISARPRMRSTVRNVILRVLDLCSTFTVGNSERLRFIASIHNDSERLGVQHDARHLAAVCRSVESRDVVSHHGSVDHLLTLAARGGVAPQHASIIVSEAIIAALEDGAIGLASHWLNQLTELVIGSEGQLGAYDLARALYVTVRYSQHVGQWQIRLNAIDALHDLYLECGDSRVRDGYLAALLHAADIMYPLDQWVPGTYHYARRLILEWVATPDSVPATEALVHYWTNQSIYACRWKEIYQFRWCWKRLVAVVARGAKSQVTLEAPPFALRAATKQQNWLNETARDDVFKDCLRVARARGVRIE